MENKEKKQGNLDTLLFHQQCFNVDGHCDTLSLAWKKRQDLQSAEMCAQNDLRKLRLGGTNLQFFAAFCNPQGNSDLLRQYLQQIEHFHQQLERYPELIQGVFSAQELNPEEIPDKTVALLSVEGGDALGGEINILHLFYRLGVRSMGLTWNNKNEISGGANDAGNTGLSKFGEEVVGEMNRLGMIIDVSHISERGFWDVLNRGQGPLIASHANCRYLKEHPRNLHDAQIKALAEKDGVLGITFVDDFLGVEESGVERVLDHIEHVVNLVGHKHVGIGSDFDGVPRPLPGLQDATDLPKLTEAMFQRGFSGEMIQHILGKNYLRVIEKVLK